MQIVDHRVWLAALALLAVACAPRHHHGGPGMGMGCGGSACRYKSECYSEGAIRSNDGVCQSCSAGKWTAATGCREHMSRECGKAAPCEREHQHRPTRH